MLSAGVERLERKKLLLMIIILTSLHKLDRKWNLREDSLLGEHRFHELLDLVVDGVMPRETLVKLFLDDHPDYHEIAATLNAHQSLMDSGNSYDYIANHCRTVDEIDNITVWFERAKESRGNILNGHHMCYLEFGELDKEVSPEECTVVRTAVEGDVTKLFKEALLHLWLNGVGLHWEKLYPEGTFQKTALPGYAFDRKSFWIQH
jgi:hypothetical protein